MTSITSVYLLNVGELQKRTGPKLHKRSLQQSFLCLKTTIQCLRIKTLFIAVK